MEFIAYPTDQQLTEIERGLNEHNAAVSSARALTRVMAVCVESGDVIAGLDSSAYWGKLHVRLLWVHPDHRSSGLGSQLMDWAEEQGRKLGCKSALVDTMSFQGPEFYAKRGYRQFGLSEGYEGGASRHYFEKQL